MAFEKQWTAVPPVALTADGSSTGVIQVVDSAGFYVKMNAQLSNSSGQTLTVEVKRVINKNVILVGPPKTPITTYTDCSAFTAALSSTISAAQQNKTVLSMEDRLLATYEQEPIDAWRTRTVDSYGNPYTDSNPLPVAFDGTVSIGDVSIVEGGNTMTVNADGSINVIVESVPSPNSNVINTYNQTSNVASGATVQIVSYTVPVGYQAVFQRAAFSGENVARYDLLINGTTQDTARTMFGGDLTGEFNFETGNDSGLIVPAGQAIVVQVYNIRPTSATFEARIQVLVLPV